MQFLYNLSLYTSYSLIWSLVMPFWRATPIALFRPTPLEEEWQGFDVYSDAPSSEGFERGSKAQFSQLQTFC